MDFLNNNIGILASELEGPYQPPIPALTYLTRDGGKTWEEKDLPLPPTTSNTTYDHCRSSSPQLFDLTSASLMVTCYVDGFETETSRFFYFSDDGGTNWQIHALPGTTRVWMADQNHGWSYGPLTELFQSIDGGAAWNPIELNLDGEIYSISFSDEEHGWLTLKMPSNGTSLFRTTDGGLTWEMVAWNE
jgi:photosystem II stability/assembly factor-like uncharacterized protein